MGPTLIDLPDDILLLVLTNLGSARDFRALTLSCRRLRCFIDEDGWRVFVRSRFPSLDIPPPSKNLQGWKKTAESLTWQSRCWDKRSLQFQALLPCEQPGRASRLRQQRGGLFQPVIDAHFDPATHEELVIWGAGEDIVARYRQRKVEGREANAIFLRSEGRHQGFTAGYDDVRALTIIKDEFRYGNHKSFLTGRDNGDLSLLSAEPGDFGRRLVEFRPWSAASGGGPGDGEAHVQQDTINSLDVLYTSQQTLIAAATKSNIFFYDLPDDDSTTVSPKTVYDLKEDGFQASASQLCRATWMGDDLVALALKGCKEPLRYMAMTPTGWTCHTAVKNPDLEKRFDIGYGNICPNSLQPVRPPGGANKGPTNLLLSAWRDGTVRLQDLRTPSFYDTVYQDNVDPWADMESLMTYGSERFVGGGMNGAAIKIFDFRWPKTYYHTEGLGCMDRDPFSEPSQPFLKRPSRAATTWGCRSWGPGRHRTPRSRCDPVLGFRCRWHNLSRHIYYRPNASFFLSNSLPRKYSGGGIWSLAKGSDMSPNFYIGISGGIIEACLEPSSSSSSSSASSSSSVINISTVASSPSSSLSLETEVTDPNFGFPSWRSCSRGEESIAVGYETLPLGAAMMETGDGFAFRQNDRAIRFPRMWTPQSQEQAQSEVQIELEGGERFDSRLGRHHRLDRRYQLVEDYLDEGGVV